MSSPGLDQIQIVEPGECTADGLESQSDEIRNIGSTDGQ